MPKVTDQQEQALRRVIRDARAIDPLISVRSLRDVVEAKTQRTVSLEYVWKLNKKVDGEIQVRPNNEKIEKKVGEMRENNRIVREALLKIAFPGQNSLPPKDSDKIRALETITKIDHSMAKIEMDFGIYTRKLGEIDIKHSHTHTVVDGRIEAITKAFENWGMAPPEMRKVESSNIIVEKNEPKPTDNKPTAPPTGSKLIPVVTGAGLVSTE